MKHSDKLRIAYVPPGQHPKRSTLFDKPQGKLIALAQQIERKHKTG